jgi:large subunit ribosomal protein L25
MKSVSISGSSRANVGKRNSKDLRANGQVPCVLYGGKEQLHFSVPSMDFKQLVYSPDAYTVDLTIDGKAYKAAMQEIQFDPIKDHIIHVDFLQLFEDKPTLMDIPVKFIGTSIGARQGGKLVANVRRLKVRALPKDLPDTVDINIENLNIGQVIRVKDLTIPGVQFLDTPNMVIVTVRVTRNVVATEEAGAKPGAASAKPAAPAKTAAKK